MATTTALAVIEEVLCRACLREASVDVAEDEGWGVFADRGGTLHTVCVECAEPERGPAG
jgi:hypothetical protein